MDINNKKNELLNKIWNDEKDSIEYEYDGFITMDDDRSNKSRGGQFYY